MLAWQGRPKDALALLEAGPPASLAGSETAARREIVQGTASYLSQRFEEAAGQLGAAQEHARDRYPALLAEVAMAQATLATYQRDYAAAEGLNLRALELARREQRPYVQAVALGGLGFTALRQQRYDAAVDWFTPALDLARQLGNRTLSAKTLGNLGWCYYKLGDYERATEMFEQAERLSSELGLAKDQYIWLNNIGNVRYDRRDYTGAGEYFTKALAIARQLDNQPGAAVCLTNLAATALEQQQVEQAERYNAEALRLKRAAGDAPSELYSLLNQARIAAARRQYAEAATVLTRIAAQAGADVSLRWEAESELAGVRALEGNAAAADRQFRKALATIDKARAGLSREELRLSFLGSAERFYNDYIDFLIARGQVRQALLVAEHSRARTLAEGLHIPVAGIAGTGFSPEQTARQQHAVILSYWLKPQRSYLWAVSGERIAAFELPARETIEAEALAYRKALFGPRDVKETANASGARLYEMLVEPAQKLIAPGARVIVVADGVLHSVNFETLLAGKPRMHYWIEDAVIANASSITLLAGGGRSKPAKAKLLLIGDPVYAGSGFPALQQAKLEVKDVAGHFAAADRQVLAGESATPDAYAASKAEEFGYIHFVAHGTASRTSPLDSSIILSRQHNAYKLYARDIIGQPLRAELVTISACYGAGTRSYSGEGLVGLSWAFLRAGAQHVIAALWEVSDTSTPELMDSLYARLQAGEDPTTALRTAKLAMLRSQTPYRRPFYWGAFQIYLGHRRG